MLLGRTAHQAEFVVDCLSLSPTLAPAWPNSRVDEHVLMGLLGAVQRFGEGSAGNSMQAAGMHAHLSHPHCLPRPALYLYCATAGAAYVYDGFVQVQSCSKKVVYKEGKMQAVGSYEIYPGPDSPVAGSPPLPPTPITPSPDQFIAKPYTMDFILRKTGDY